MKPIARSGETSIKTGRETYRRIDRHIDSKSDINTGRETYRLADRHID